MATAIFFDPTSDMLRGAIRCRRSCEAVTRCTEFPPVFPGKTFVNALGIASAISKLFFLSTNRTVASMLDLSSLRVLR